MAEILPKNTCDKGDRHKYCGNDCQLLHYSIQTIRYSGEVDIQHTAHQVAVRIQYFKCTHEVIMYIRKIWFSLSGDQFPCACYQCIGNLDLWADAPSHQRQGSFHMEDIPLHIF